MAEKKAFMYRPWVDVYYRVEWTEGRRFDERKRQRSAFKEFEDAKNYADGLYMSGIKNAYVYEVINDEPEPEI